MGTADLLVVSALAFWGTVSCGGAVSITPPKQTGGSEVVVDGIKTMASAFGPKETMDRLETAVKTKGITVFARIDHAAGAAIAGLTLRPTELLIFGNARAGTPLMQARQSIGLDLPLKALVWQDASGQTWLSYNDPQWIVSRHGGDASLDRMAREMAEALVGLLRAATQAP